MTPLKKYHQHKDKWWALPLVLPCLLLPLFNLANTYTHVAGETVVLFSLPMALMFSLMVVFGWAALPGMVLALVLNIGMHDISELVAQIFHLLIPVVISWGGYRVFVTRRQNIAYGNAAFIAQRIFWQVFCPATIYLIILEFVIWLALYDTDFSKTDILSLNIHLLIDYQALLVGTMTGIPLCYLVIRIIRHPRYLRSWLSQLRHEFDPKVTRCEMAIWLSILAGLVILLLMPLNENSSIFSTNYTLSLVLPVMLWGALRYGYRFISVLWTLLLIVSVHYFLSLSSRLSGL